VHLLNDYADEPVEGTTEADDEGDLK
jgi:hypothetical protein